MSTKKGFGLADFHRSFHNQSMENLDGLTPGRVWLAVTVFFALIGPVVVSLYYIRKDFFAAWDTSKIVLFSLSVSAPLAAINGCCLYIFQPGIAGDGTFEKLIVITAFVTGFVLYLTSTICFVRWEFFKKPPGFPLYMKIAGGLQLMMMVVIIFFGKKLI